MPDQELLDDVLEALEQTGSPVKNPVLRQAKEMSCGILSRARQR